MKRHLFMVFCMLLSAACFVQTRANAACTVYVRGIVGVVEVYATDDTDWDDAELNQCLQVGDKVRTGADGQVNLDFTSRADVSLDALSEFRITSSKPDADADQLDLTKGTASAKAQKLSSGTSFSIKTPTAVAGVRGTDFDVEVDDSGDSDVVVTDGEVDITNEFGQFRARKGEGMRFRRGMRPDKPRKINIEEWKKKVAAWKDKIKKGKDLRNERQRMHRNRIRNRIKNRHRENAPERGPRGGPFRNKR